MARPLLKLPLMKPQPTVVHRIKVNFHALVAKLRALFAVHPPLQPIPIPRHPREKDIERWRNEGGH